MSGPDVMGIVAEGRTSIPTHKAALNSARFLRKPPEGIGHLQKLILAAGFRLGLGKWGEWRTAVRAEIAKAWTGEVAPDTALRTATQIGDAALQRLGLP